MTKYRRLLAMGDIHGQYNLMCDVLTKAEYNPVEDQLILLGDYIDRGTDSKLVVDKVRELVAGGAVALLGNHELMMIRAIRSKEDMLDGYSSEAYRIWSHDNGGNKTKKSFKNNLLEMRRAVKFFLTLPAYYETEHFVFVHGAVDTRLQNEEYIPMEEQRQEYMLWQRHSDSPKVKYSEKIVVVGHTPVQLINNDVKSCQPVIEDHAIYLDTGAAWSGKCVAALTLMDVVSKEYWQA